MEQTSKTKIVNNWLVTIITIYREQLLANFEIIE